jgi:hypothetical protein
MIEPHTCKNWGKGGNRRKVRQVMRGTCEQRDNVEKPEE